MLVQRDKRRRMKVLLSSFHLNGHFRISSKDCRVRTNLDSIIKSTLVNFFSLALV